MSGKAPRQKGSRLERTAVEILRSAGLDAHRMPLSGSQKGFAGDVDLRLKGGRKSLEAKSRKSGFNFIYQSLGMNYALIIKQDRHEPLAVVTLQELARLISGAEWLDRHWEKVEGLSRNPIESPSRAYTVWDQIVQAKTRGILCRTYQDVTGRYYTAINGRAVQCDAAGKPLQIGV